MQRRPFAGRANQWDGHPVEEVSGTTHVPTAWEAVRREAAAARHHYCRRQKHHRDLHVVDLQARRRPREARVPTVRVWPARRELAVWTRPAAARRRRCHPMVAHRHRRLLHFAVLRHVWIGRAGRGHGRRQTCCPCQGGVCQGLARHTTPGQRQLFRDTLLPLTLPDGVGHDFALDNTTVYFRLTYDRHPPY